MANAISYNRYCNMPNGLPNQETRSIQSLDRGLAILEAVAKSTEPVSLGELTNLLGIDRSSVFRLANTLKRRGFLAYPERERTSFLVRHSGAFRASTTGVKLSFWCRTII